MTRNIIQRRDRPHQTLGKRITKLSKKARCKIRVAAELLAGNYTSQVIDRQWPENPNRTDLINDLIARHRYQSYLEIGCRDDECFAAVAIDRKVGVDPNSGGTLRMTSDEFFAQNADRFDIIFIDGMHVYEQVRRDILHSVEALNPGGTIVMHDCLPTSCLAQYHFPATRTWNGDVWKAFVEARTLPHLDAATCLVDHGVGVIKKRANSNPLVIPVDDFTKLKYSFLVHDYMALLNALDYEQTLAFAADSRPRPTSPVAVPGSANHAAAIALR